MIRLRHHAFFQRCGSRDNLKNTARLVSVIQALISPHLIQRIILTHTLLRLIVIRQRKRMVGIKFRQIHHRIEFPIGRVHHNNLHTVRILLFQHLLGSLHRISLYIIIEC